MKFFQYAPLFGAILNFLLSLFVVFNDRRSRLNQVFFAWGICITIWNAGTYALFRAGTMAEAETAAHLMQYGVIFLPITMLHLTIELCGYKAPRTLLFLYLCHAGFAVMNWSNLFISGVHHVGYAYYSIAGIGFKLYSVFFTQTWISLIILWKKRSSLPPRERTRFNGIAAAQTGILTLGTNDILPILGYDRYPFTGTAILPWGSLAAAAYVVMVAYSVFQHQLLDVRLALGRSSAHFVRFFFLLLIAVLLELTVAVFAPKDQFSAYALMSSVAVIAIATLLASVLFPKLLGSTSEKLERRLLGDHFEYQDRIRAFIERCRWHTELDALLTDLHLLLVNTLNVRGYSLILRDEINRAFALARSHPAGVRVQIPELSSDSPIYQFFSVAQKVCLPLGSGYIHENDALEISARQQIKDIPGVLAFPFLVDQHPLGILVIDEKGNHRSFTRTDIQLLRELTTNVALVINQVSLKNQLLQARELDLLGRMSQGMAHDLNNLTTPVWTLLQLLTEGVSQETLCSDLAPVAIRNIQTMREYIREALFFSENLRPDFHMGRLDAVVQEVIELARENKRKGKDIEYSLRFSGDVLVEMDHVLIRRLLGNVIANAVDASSQRSRIEVEIIRLVKTDPERDWFRVRVTDYGSGIPEENMERIFQPYFTTKKTGDEDRGFGLGLAICRKIATLHSGSLVVSSEVGKGTVVNLDLPNCRKAPKTPQSPLLVTSEA
jgi:signal transduction histidine kinase